MKIVINATPLLSPLTGVGNYTYHLATEFRRLKPDFDYTYYYGYFSKRLKFYPHVSSRFLEFKDSKILTIHLGYNDLFKAMGKEKIKNKLYENYILFVGLIEPKKNLVSLLKAYLLLPEYTRKEFKLLLVGFKGWGNKEILELLDKLQGSVYYLGYVKNEELVDLYRGASCFAYPSFYEGFGLPPPGGNGMWMPRCSLSGDKPPGNLWGCCLLC
jgi:glycosyltransferase involved in cell wall biosynthesis